jgi:Xaa-Pro aminopeptidase
MKSFPSYWLKVFLSFSLLVVSLLLPASVTAQTDPFQARRTKLIEKTDKGLIILKNGKSPDGSNTSVQNKNFFYLTGLYTPEAYLVIEGKSGKSTIYREVSRYRQPDPLPAGLEGKSMEDFDKDLAKLVMTNRNLWVEFDQLTIFGKPGIRIAAETIKNPSQVINGMRPVKDETEIGLIKKSAEINALGLVEMMKAAEPGMNEKDLELILDYSFKKLGSTGYSFGIQAASGPNSTSIHYYANDRTTETGDMMVFDVGAKYQNYTADISRTIPVSGKFTKEQKEIYSIVLNAQKAGIAKMLPGKGMEEADVAVTNELNKGLFALGLITDTLQNWQRTIWMQHGWDHSIGLVVHDVAGPYVRGQKEVLEPGMIYTMEPGLYFPANYFDKSNYKIQMVPEVELKAFMEKVEPIFKKYINIGVRIEDDVLITPTGNEVITKAVPKEIVDIEATMKLKSRFN